MSNSCCHCGVGGERDAGTGLAGGLDVQHFRGQVDDRRLGRGLLADPGLAADAGQGRATLGAPHILLDQPDPHGRDVDLRAAVELDLQMLFRPAVLLDLSQAAIATDAVRQVHDQVPFAQFEEAVDRLAQAAAGRPPQLAALKQLGAADQNHPLADQAKSFAERADEQMQTDRPAPMAVSAKISPSRWRSASVLAIRKTSCSAPLWSSSSRTLAMSPLNRCTDSICRRHVDPGAAWAIAAAVASGNCQRARVHVAAETRIPCGDSRREK